MTATKPVKQVCATCGSENVTNDALAAWNTETQEWELQTLLQNADCNDCGEPRRIESRPITDEELLPESVEDSVSYIDWLINERPDPERARTVALALLRLSSDEED